MSYPAKPTFDELIERALNDAEIRQVIDSTEEINDARLRERLGEAKGRIEEEAGTAREQRDAAISKLKQIRERIQADEPVGPRVRTLADVDMPLGCGGFFIGIGFILTLIYGAVRGWAKLLEYRHEWQGWVMAFVAILTAIGVWAAVSWLRNRRVRAALGAHEADVRLYKDEKASELGLMAATEALEAADERLVAAIYESGIKAEARQIISEATQPDYGVVLTAIKGPGLSEVFDASYEITTDAKDRLRALLPQMPGGSIGVAGPRGVGKSTLLRSFCGGGIKEIAGRKLLAVPTSAPVKYDAREFILYLFASVCRAALVAKGATEMAPPQMGAPRPPSAVERVLESMPALLPQVAMGVGAALIVVSVFLTTALADFPAPPTTKPSTALTTGPSTGPSHAEPSDAATWADHSDEWAWFRAFLKATDIKPTMPLYAGIACAAAGWALLRLPPGVARRTRRGETPDERRREDKLDDFSRAARETLHDIRFQQTFSSGWSGALKLPVGIESGLTGGISLVEKQRTLPELIAQYQSFLRTATTSPESWTVVIGIDELDKLESDEAAQRFLNEIKALFNLPRCFYLLSVSENAISGFERRGLPIRDAFDSAFDFILYVDYLKLDRSKRLLRRRVVGIQVPFLCLCHCLSGGLARDLVRACRDLLEVACGLPATHSRDLDTLCSIIVLGDIRAKLRAIEISVRQLTLEPEVSDRLEVIRKLDESTATSSQFLSSRKELARCVNLSALKQDTTKTDAAPREPKAEHERLNGLDVELNTYLYFAATLLEYFTNRLTMQELQADENSGQIENLARSRQKMAVNHFLSRKIITEFRKAKGFALDVEEGQHG